MLRGGLPKLDDLFIESILGLHVDFQDVNNKMNATNSCNVIECGGLAGVSHWIPPSLGNYKINMV